MPVRPIPRNATVQKYYRSRQKGRTISAMLTLRRLLSSAVVIGAFIGSCLAAVRFGRPRADLSPALALGLLVTAGFMITTILVDSKITRPFRQLIGKIPGVGPELYQADAAGHGVDGLLACPMCVSPWVGVLLAAAGLRPWTGSALDYGLQGAAGAAGTLLLYALYEFLTRGGGDALPPVAVSPDAPGVPDVSPTAS